jgi:3-phenylpropionate/cinnamic acid dioxygenase small subunit
MTDEQLIANLLYRYADLIDTGDFDGLTELFAHAEYKPGGGSFTGAQVTEMMAQWTKRYEDGTPRTKHVTTNIALDIQGDAATSQSYYTVMQSLNGHIEPIIAGRYHDRFERFDGTWRFAERRILVDLVGDLSQHLNHKIP